MKRLAAVLCVVVLAFSAAALAVVASPADPAAITLPPAPRSPLQGGHLSEGDPRSPVIVPPQRLEVRFSHSLHVKNAELPCAHCHEQAAASRSTKDLLVPPRSLCMDCHDANEVPGDWGPGVKAPVIDIPAANLHFSHERHLSLEGVTCASCHAGVEDGDLATAENLPSMEQCLSCHVERGAPTDCRTCHAKGRAGTIRTKYDEGMLIPDDHGVHWLKQHGVEAERDMGQCASCHAQEDCLSCHDGAIPPTFHAGNYLAMHPQDAMANNPQCASCHRLERFCRDCHFKAEVTFGNPLVNGVTGSFHPQDWLIPGQSDFHGNVARKNIASCSGCHAQEDCTSCHAFYQGAPRIHPAGWASSRRMRQLRDANIATCLQCHGRGEIGDPIPGP